MVGRALCSASVLLLLAGCGSTASSEIGECVDDEITASYIDSDCLASELYGQYITRVGIVWLENAGPPGTPKSLVITHGPGPSLESICFKRYRSSPSRRILTRAARAVARVPIPDELTCTVGHRLDLHHG